MIECYTEGISGTFRLGLGQEKWIYIHWESHLVHNLELREAPLVRYQVDNLSVQNWRKTVDLVDQIGTGL